MKLALAEVYEVATFYAHFDVVKEGETPPPPVTVRVCNSLSCAMAGAEKLLAELPEQARPRCARGARALHGRLRPRAGMRGRPCADFPGRMPRTSPPPARQARMRMHCTGQDFEQYRADGGYALLKSCVTASRTREDIIKAVNDAGLRGLGGAGFPTGRKWTLVRAEPAPRLFAVNADEGEPGTFKDRHYLDRDPHRFIEGMLIAAWVVEAGETYIYIRDEYPEVRLMLLEEIAKVEQAGLSPHTQVASAARRRRLHLRRRIRDDRIDRRQARAAAPSPALSSRRSVCSAARRSSRMSRRMYWLRDIIEKGAAWFTSQGRHERKGFRCFSVSGRVKDPGVKLAPAGITARELIDEFCGGMADGHSFKGYLPGGASGGILPASMADIPLDFGTLEPHGCFVGSHAVVILSEQDDMKAVALNLMSFSRTRVAANARPAASAPRRR